MTLRRTTMSERSVPAEATEASSRIAADIDRVRQSPTGGDPGGMVLSDDITELPSAPLGHGEARGLHGDRISPDEFAAKQAAAAEREAAIEAAHAQDLPYYDGTTTIDGETYEVYLLPDGSTAYYDPDTETVVDVSWPSDEAKQAAIEAAHAEEQAFYDGTTTIDGEVVEVWLMPDGSTVYYDRSEQSAVAIEWPGGDGPEYQGQVVVDGEVHSLYEYPNGTQVLVDENGQIVGDLDDAEVDTFWHEGLGRDVYAVPLGPPSYDTAIYDAATGDPLEVQPSGKELPGTGHTIYEPHGEDYFLVLDSDGDIIAVQAIPPDENWSILGIVTSYDDGTVVVDVGVGDIVVDVSTDGGIWFESEMLGELFDGGEWFATGSMGIEWDSSSVKFFAETDLAGGAVAMDFEQSADWSDGFVLGWDIDYDVDTPLVDADLTIDLDTGVTSDGQLFAHAGGDVAVDVLGLVSVDGDIDLRGEAGLQGIHVEGSLTGEADVLGARASTTTEFSGHLDENGLRLDGHRSVELGIDGLGEIDSGIAFEVETDGTLAGSHAGVGGWTDVTDADGETTGFGQGYRPEDDGPGSSRLPGWDRIDADGPPTTAPDGSADMELDLDDPSRGMSGPDDESDERPDGEPEARPWDQRWERRDVEATPNGRFAEARRRPGEPEPEPADADQRVPLHDPTNTPDNPTIPRPDTPPDHTDTDQRIPLHDPTNTPDNPTIPRPDTDTGDDPDPDGSGRRLDVFEDRPERIGHDIADRAAVERGDDAFHDPVGTVDTASPAAPQTRPSPVLDAAAPTPHDPVEPATPLHEPAPTLVEPLAEVLPDPIVEPLVEVAGPPDGWVSPDDGAPDDGGDGADLGDGAE